MTFAFTFPAIDPVLIEIGPIVIRWYALAYIAGLLLGWQLMRRLARSVADQITEIDVDDFLVWATAGVILGGRLGYILFYRLDYYLDNPMNMLAVWQGGMSFHGGFLGVIVAAILFTRKRKIPPLLFGDLLGCVAPVGLFFGRLANFINGELFGRVSDVPWAVIFPRGGPDPRHPSQLYEAGLEGLVLFGVLMVISRSEIVRRRHGTRIGIFMVGYGLARSIVELYRQPDAHLGFISGNITMGQLLSVPMLLAGAALIVYTSRKDRAAAEK